MKLSTSYLAGLFDGEGCIFIGRREPKRRMIMPYYVLTASINMTHRPLIEVLAAQFGRPILVHRKDLKNINHRVAYEVVFATDAAAEFLKSIYDELFIKKEEARIALAFQDHLNQFRGRAMYMCREDLTALLDYRERLRLQLKACKKVSFFGASDWDVGEFGGHPMPDLFGEAEGQYRAKQELATPGVCNESVPTSKEKMDSALHRNMQNTAEMTVSHLKKVK